MSSKVTRLLVITLCLYLIITTIGGISDLWKAGDKEVKRQKTADQLELEKEELEAQVKKATSSAFLEAAARDQLGMSKPGEEIVIVSSELLGGEPKTATVEATPNWKRWTRLLF